MRTSPAVKHSAARCSQSPARRRSKMPPNQSRRPPRRSNATSPKPSAVSGYERGQLNSAAVTGLRNEDLSRSGRRAQTLERPMEGEDVALVEELVSGPKVGGYRD
ncbi:AUTOPHAGY 6 [Striga asiatica]|uniref:AUTOPHAGY 6 n=1 Tax=Striga asiatica TaxID=4170 RepID=A0A5A7P436_STRAF|nr:AUTOPHAGY 6 [Striga asiatica]